MAKKIGCAAFVMVVAVLGIWVNFKPQRFSAEGQQALADFIQRFGDSGSDYTVLSAQKGDSRSTDASENLQAFSGFGGDARPAGVCPGGELVKETWCVITDKALKMPSGEETFTHFIVQKQNQLWVVEEVADSEQEMFLHFGCHKW